MKKTNHQQGQSVIELLIAIFVFTIAMATIIFLILDSEVASRKNVERTRAILFAQEGLEGVRSLRDKDFANLTNGTYGLILQGGKWVLQGTSDTTGTLTRTIDITNTATGLGTGTNTGEIDGGNPGNDGTIKVCKIVIDAYKNQNNGLGYADSFKVTLRKPNNGASWTVTFTPPINATEDILSDAPGLDAACVENINLPYGQYSYNAEVITNGGSNWQTVTYNDQYTAAISTVNDFYAYNANLDSNGLIDITAQRKDRALVMLNKITQTATALGDSRTVKQVVSTVSWPTSLTQTESVELTEFFSNWNRKDIDRLTVDLTGARIASGTSNKGIRGILLSNNTAKSITIDRMILTWNKPSSSLSKITINGTQVFSGTVASGTNNNITNVVLSPGTFNVEINPFLWTQSMTGISVGLTIIMTDGSSKQYTIPAL
jgi:hypothetical protein